ncbi:hypothetical protein ACLKA7_001465 [Drosophila subpalustris]
MNKFLMHSEDKDAEKICASSSEEEKLSREPRKGKSKTLRYCFVKFWGNFRRCVLERHSKSFQPEKAQPELHKH